MTDLPDMALSIRQPWAWAIVYAGKDVENREWSTKFRGPVCIHASKNASRRDYSEAAMLMDSLSAGAPHRLSVERGGIIGTADIVDCIEKSDSPWFFGRYGFVLANVRPVDFIPCAGALGFFNWRERHRNG